MGKREVALKLATGGGEEASLLGKLRHPNIVPVYSVQQDEATGLVAFCMPYLGRATLADVLDVVFETAAPPRAPFYRRCDASHQRDWGSGGAASHRPDVSRGTYLDGVLYLTAKLATPWTMPHRQGICHRDLKPSNVLLPRDGRPLLLDFNLAADGVLPPQRVGGTLPYMAPEQLTELLQDSDGPYLPAPEPRCDLFSLGVMLYQLLTGTLPFGPISDEGSIREVAEQLLRQLEGPSQSRTEPASHSFPWPNCWRSAYHRRWIIGPKRRPKWQRRYAASSTLAPRTKMGAEPPTPRRAWAGMVLVAVVVALSLWPASHPIVSGSIVRAWRTTNRANGNWPRIRSPNHYDPIRATSPPSGLVPVPCAGLGNTRWLTGTFMRCTN